MLRWIILAFLIAVACWLAGREFLVLGEVRRAGMADKMDYRRFRRRIKGVLLLVLLYALAAFYEDIARFGLFTLREAFLYSGIFVIVLFWLLIVTSRDIKATAYMALYERQRMTLESLSDIEKEIIKYREEQKELAGKESPGASSKAAKYKHKNQ